MNFIGWGSVLVGYSVTRKQTTWDAVGFGIMSWNLVLLGAQMIVMSLRWVWKDRTEPQEPEQGVSIPDLQKVKPEEEPLLD